MSHSSDELEQLREHLEHLLGFPHAHLPAQPAWRPAADAFETDTEFVVRMDISGLQMEDLSVRCENHVLVIRGTRRDSLPPGRKHFHKMEIRVGPFERRFALPRDCGGEGVLATYTNGILEIRVPRKSGDQPREIQITTG